MAKRAGQAGLVLLMADAGRHVARRDGHSGPAHLRLQLPRHPHRPAEPRVRGLEGDGLLDESVGTQSDEVDDGDVGVRRGLGVHGVREPQLHPEAAARSRVEAGDSPGRSGRGQPGLQRDGVEKGRIDRPWPGGDDPLRAVDPVTVRPHASLLAVHPTCQKA
ncbi:hypothetical protein GCM10011509_16870 [Ornithinimicrobium pekingense]|uniref:Uncharacterized protein n=1 Tax=Ornithinimicrobium pekingense TaxID=384677 RepID=A0ABQ2F8H9_9MICO|nr:hypothetical protein GCM10011509_16870 [Ornithinimicrobium pekingense]